MYRDKKEKRIVHLIAHNNPKSPITEQYRLIKNNLHFASVDKQLKSIVITSPEKSDGKSTTAANLAVVLAQQGKQVLLADADLRKPSAHYIFNVSNLTGLTDVLARKIELDRAIVKTYIPELDILPSGATPPNPSELLNSKAMESVIEELVSNYEYVIFDTPPLLVVTESQILSNKCDGVILVVASGKTTKDQAMKAKELLEKANSNLLGVVVNGVEASKASYYGQYE